MDAYFALATVFVSGLFALAVAFVSSKMARKLDDRRYRRDLESSHHSRVESLYVDVIAGLERAIRCTENLGDYAEVTSDLPCLNARMTLCATSDVLAQYERVSDLLLCWSTEYRKGMPKPIGDTGFAMVHAGDSAHSANASELRSDVIREIVGLSDLMKVHLNSIRPNQPA